MLISSVFIQLAHLSQSYEQQIPPPFPALEVWDCQPAYLYVDWSCYQQDWIKSESKGSLLSALKFRNDHMSLTTFLFLNFPNASTLDTFGNNMSQELHECNFLGAGQESKILGAD